MGGPDSGQGHNLLMQFSSLGSSKMEISETDFFFNILTIQNDEISYVKHALDPPYVFFTLFGVFFGGGGPKGATAENWKFTKLIFFFLYSDHSQ